MYQYIFYRTIVVSTHRRDRTGLPTVCSSVAW